LPLSFSYSATDLRKAASSCGTKPCDAQTVAVLAAALAMYGRDKAPVAKPTDPTSTERRLIFTMTVILPCSRTFERRRFTNGFVFASLLIRLRGVSRPGQFRTAVIARSKPDSFCRRSVAPPVFVALATPP
jgi:hypothetical protein